jgi:hypothetical protein
MLRFLTRFAPLHGTQSVRITVAWRKQRVRRVKLEYARPHLVRRLIEAAMK